MFKKRSIVSALELGTSKITVLIGESGEDDRLDIIGKGVAPSRNSIVKGEIVNMEQAIDQTCQALEEADQAAGGQLYASRAGVVTVTGAGIDSFQGVGTVFIRNEEQRITEAAIEEAHQNARLTQSAPDRTILGSSESYFLIDGQRRVRNPLGQVARKLDACIHVVHGVTTRLENFRRLVREVEFAELPDLVFSAQAAGIGVLSREERENGVLLVDFGAGATEYYVEFDSGTLASGQLQLGFDHVLNDLAEAFKLPLEHWRRLVEDGSLSRLLREQKSHLELTTASGRVRRVPVGSIETVIDLRLRELFGIVREELQRRSALNNLASGGVLTGGGALFERSSTIFREVLQMSSRVGVPMEVGGAVTGLDNPRYSAVWGALKIADALARDRGPGDSPSLGNLFGRVGGWFDGLLQTGRELKESIKL